MTPTKPPRLPRLTISRLAFCIAIAFIVCAIGGIMIEVVTGVFVDMRIVMTLFFWAFVFAFINHATRSSPNEPPGNA